MLSSRRTFHSFTRVSGLLVSPGYRYQSFSSRIASIVGDIQVSPRSSNLRRSFSQNNQQTQVDKSVVKHSTEANTSSTLTADKSQTTPSTELKEKGDPSLISLQTEFPAVPLNSAYKILALSNSPTIEEIQDSYKKHSRLTHLTTSTTNEPVLQDR